MRSLTSFPQLPALRLPLLIARLRADLALAALSLLSFSLSGPVPLFSGFFTSTFSRSAREHECTLPLGRFPQKCFFKADLTSTDSFQRAIKNLILPSRHPVPSLPAPMTPHGSNFLRFEVFYDTRLKPDFFRLVKHRLGMRKMTRDSLRIVRNPFFSSFEIDILPFQLPV